MAEPQFEGESETIRKRRTSISNRELLIEAEIGNVSNVRKLLAKGSDVNYVDAEGDTVLHYAVRSGNLQVVGEILCKIKDVFVDNNNNETALTIAQQFGNKDIITCLQTKIFADSLNQLKGQFPDTTELCNNPVSNFIDETISGNYTTSLTLEDVNTILKVKQMKQTEGILLKELEEKWKSCEIEKSCIFIIQLEASQWALLVIKNTGVFYTDSLNNSEFDAVKECLGVNLQPFQWQQNVHKYDSCIYVLNNAEIINSNLSDNLEKLQQRLNDAKINCVEERQFLANILNEVKRTNDKIEFCLRTLQTLNSCEEDVSGFTFKNANAFILFLETFALEDTYPHIYEENPHKEEILRKLRKLKKEYYTNYYKPNKAHAGKPDIRLICDARNKILHSNSKIINPKDFTSFIAENMRNSEGGIINFFKSLEKYTETVYNKIRNINNESANINCNLFLASIDANQIIGEDGDLVEIYLPFLLKTYELRDIEEMMFSLTANVIPALDNKNEEMRELNKVRNTLIHNFLQYKNTDERLKDFENIIRSIRSKLFKYYYSSEFHKLLENLTKYAGDTFKISKEFKQKMENFGNKFQKRKNDNIESTEDVEGSFEYKFSKSLFPKKDDDIKELVDLYLKFMIITYNEEIENHLEKSVRHKKITSLERRKIFERFIELKNIGRFSPTLLKNKKKTMFGMLKVYGIRKDLFNEIVKLYIDADKKLQHIKESKINQITGILNFLKRIKSDYRFSNKKVILLYEHFIKGLKFQEENQKLQEQFNNLPVTETIELRIGEAVIKINTFNIITDMLEVFYSSYNEYQMKFNNLGEAFTDSTFLDYLIDKDVYVTKGKYVFKNSNFVFIIIKKLLNQHFAAPYIAGLLIKVGNDQIIENDDLQELIETLLYNDVFITHLDKLLHITSNKANLYAIVCNKIKNIKSIYSILKEPKHADGILKELMRRRRNKHTSQLIKDTLIVLNDVSLECYKRGDYDIALKLLDNEAVKSAHKLFNSQDKYVIDARYQIAITKNELGTQLIDKKMYDEARKIFKEIVETLEKQCESPKYLLSWIEWAHTNYLLQEHDVLFTLKVYERFRRYALGLQFNGDIQVKDISDNLKNEYNEIISSTRYKNFISNPEFRHYSDILSIRSVVPYNKCYIALQCKNRGDNENAFKEYKEALKMYHEIYTIQKACGGNRINHTIKNIALIHLQIASIVIEKNQIQYHLYEGLIKRMQIMKNQTSDYEKSKKEILSLAAKIKSL